MSNVVMASITAQTEEIIEFCQTEASQGGVSSKMPWYKGHGCQCLQGPLSEILPKLSERLNLREGQQRQTNIFAFLHSKEDNYEYPQEKILQKTKPIRCDPDHISSHLFVMNISWAAKLCCFPLSVPLPRGLQTRRAITNVPSDIRSKKTSQKNQVSILG